MKPVPVEVAYIPKEVRGEPRPVCVLVDVLRASTTMVTLLEKGCPEIVLTRDEREIMEKHPHFRTDGTLICAEDVYGNATEGADFSPSLSEIEHQAVKGRRVVLRTTNGTLAAQTLWERGIRDILIGCMQNGKAVMERAVRLAWEKGLSISVVCAGRENGGITALDDAYCAGMLIRFAKEAAREAGICIQWKDSAKMACHLLRAYSGPEEAFADSGSGETMRRIDCVSDISVCARINVSSLAPEIHMKPQSGLIIVKKTTR